MATYRSGAAAAAWAGRLHVVGGETPSGGPAVHEANDPARDRWEILAPLPPLRAGAAAMGSDGGRLVIGGRTSVDGPPGARASGAVEFFGASNRSPPIGIGLKGARGPAARPEFR